MHVQLNRGEKKTVLDSHYIRAFLKQSHCRFEQRLKSGNDLTSHIRWNCCIPLFLGLRSTQSPIKAPKRSTDPATTNPNTAVNSRLRPYSSIRNTEIAKCHMRSPCSTQHGGASLLFCEVLHVCSHKTYSKWATLHLFKFQCFAYFSRNLFLQEMILTHIDNAPLT